MLAKLPKWFYSSFRKYLEDSLSGYGVYFSGDAPKPDAKIDIIIIGPKIDWIAKDQYNIEMQTTLNIKVPVEEDKSYLVHTMAGEAMSTLLSKIPIYKFGDDASLLDCMQIPNDSRRSVRYVHHGIVDPDTELIQATVLAKHDLTLNLGD